MLPPSVSYSNRLKTLPDLRITLLTLLRGGVSVNRIGLLTHYHAFSILLASSDNISLVLSSFPSALRSQCRRQHIVVPIVPTGEHQPHDVSRDSFVHLDCKTLSLFCLRLSRPTSML